jgi:hypothetical protein
MSRAVWFSLLIALSALGPVACSVPNLESPACTESKSAIREFYSIHFGNEMRFSAEGLKSREKYLSTDLAARLVSSKEGTDPFTTGTDDIPRAFRVGECREISPERTESNVLLLWRDDQRTEQRMIRVEAVDVNDTWLINNVSR